MPAPTIRPAKKVNILFSFFWSLRYLITHFILTSNMTPPVPPLAGPAHLVLMLTLRLVTTWFILPATWVTAATPVKSLNAPSCTVADAF